METRYESSIRVKKSNKALITQEVHAALGAQFSCVCIVHERYNRGHQALLNIVITSCVHGLHQ